MHVLEIECACDDKDRIIAGLWESGTTGVIEHDLSGGRCRLSAYFDSEVRGLAQEYGGTWKREEPQDWVEVAQAQWEPVLAGERFFLIPSWRDDPTPPGRLRLEMQPGLACGTGWHPATQLALEGMERTLRPGASVLDIGTGSGILSVAAAMLGAGRIFACDIDLEATLAAQKRFRDSAIDVALLAGSVRSIRAHAVDLIVANINAEALVQLAPEINRARTGAAILTGFPRRHLERVEAAYGRGTVLEKGEWAALVC